MRLIRVFLCLLLAASAAFGQTTQPQKDAREIGFAPAAVRFPNLAPQDASTWGSLTGLATVTTGQPAPDGTAGAALISTTTNQTAYKRIVSSNRNFAVGDWIVFGVWVKASGATASLRNYPIATVSVQGAGFTLNTNTNSKTVFTTSASDREWEWLTLSAKVAAVGSPATAELRLEFFCDQYRRALFYTPVLHQIPAGAMSDNEVEIFRKNLFPAPDGVPAGNVALVRGQQLYCYQGGVYAPCIGGGSAGGPWINVTQAGLTCNGVVDDSLALTALINNSAAGSTFYIPAGKNCNLSSGVTFNKRIQIRGDGFHSAISCNVGSGADCITYDAGGGNIMDGVILQDFAILGTSSQNGLVWRNITRSKIDNVYISPTTAAGGYGFKGEGVLINQFRVHVTNSIPYPFTYGAPANGILLTGSAQYPSNANLLENCIVEHGPGKGIFIDGSTGTPGTVNNWIIGGTIEGEMDEGIHLKNANYSTILGVHVEDTVGSPFTGASIILENTTNTTVGHGTSIGASLQLINADDCRIDGITVDAISIDSSSQRNRIGLVQYSLNGGSLTDNGVDTIYEGQITNASNANAARTGAALGAASLNLLQNGGAEYWNGAQPTDWGLSSGSLTKTGTGQADTTKKFGDFAAKTDSGIQYVLVDVRQPELSQILDQPITLSAWVRIPSGQGTQPNVQLQVWYDGGATSYAGDSTNATDAWVRLEFAARVPSGATQVQLVLANTATGAGGEYYIDGLSIVYGKASHPTEAPRILRAPALELRTPAQALTTVMPTASSAITLNLPGVAGTLAPYTATGGDFFTAWNAAGTALETAPVYKLGSASVFMGGQLFNTDNANDIGASGSNRPRTIYAATGVQAPRLGLAANIDWTQGSGSPEGAVTKDIGAIYSRNDGSGGSTLYVKESGSGNTGWTAVSTGGGGGGISGSGTSGTYTKFTGTSSVGNALLTESGTVVSLPGELSVTQTTTSNVGFSLRAAGSATAELMQAKDSGGNVRGGYAASGAFFFRGFSSAPTNSLSNDGKLFYDISGGVTNQQLLLSKNTGTYNPVIVANNASHTNNVIPRWSSTAWELDQSTLRDNVTLVQFGGTSSSFPGLKRSSTEIQVRLADDSTYGDFGARFVTVNGRTISTDADGTVGALSVAGSFTKNDSNTRSFSSLRVKPTLNTGGSNANTTLDLVQIDTTNTGVTGLTVNLINAMYGGAARFKQDSAGVITQTLSTSNTNLFYDGRIYDLSSAGTAAAGFGLGSLVKLENGSGSQVDAGRITTSWTVATAGSETSKVSIGTNSAGGGLADSFTVEADQQYGVANTANVSGSITINFHTGNQQVLTLTGNVTSVTLSNVKDGAFYWLVIQQDGAGGKTWNMPSAIKIAGGSSGTSWGQTLTAGAKDELICRGLSGNLHCLQAYDVK
jgi:hypothetical protein